MRVQQWCKLGVTILLLVCEVTVSQLCQSIIILMDGFHTLFVLIHMTLSPRYINPPLSSLDLPASPPHASSAAIKPLPDTQATWDGPTPTPSSLSCGLSYTSCRLQSLGGFLSALVLASLCFSALMEVIGLFVAPKTVQYPLVLVAVSTGSLLYKMLVLWLNWDQQQGPETESLIEVNHKVLAEGGVEGQNELGPVLSDVHQVHSAVDDSLNYGAIVLCNPGASSIADTESSAPEPQAEVCRDGGAPQDSRDSKTASSVAVLSHCKDITDTSKEDVWNVGSQNTSNTSPICKLCDLREKPVCLLASVLIIQGLGTAVLALINSLAIVLTSSQCPQSSGACALLVYLDPGLSLLAVIVLIVIAMPQVCRYGMLLLQATPPHICMSDLGQRIKSVPGVQALHDFHIWQLTESFMVASVHVHCRADFPAHRCTDVLSGVTKVLKSVGVNCCTIQPEFVSWSSSSSCDTSPEIQRVDPSLPSHLACSLACTKACAGSMCCPPLEDESRILLAPPAGETKKEPETLVMETTSLKRKKSM